MDKYRFKSGEIVFKVMIRGLVEESLDILIFNESDLISFVENSVVKTKLIEV